MYYNQMVSLVDAAIGCNVVNTTTTTPPTSPLVTDRYLVAAGATGAWAGKDGKLAYLVAGAWSFLTPVAGLVLYDQSKGDGYMYNGSIWISLGKSIHRTVVSDTNYTILATDSFISVVALTAARSLTLPSPTVVNHEIEIKDESGAAGSHTVAIVGTIEGVTNPTITTNYGSVRIYSNGTNFFYR